MLRSSCLRITDDLQIWFLRVRICTCPSGAIATSELDSRSVVQRKLASVAPISRTGSPDRMGAGMKLARSDKEPMSVKGLGPIAFKESSGKKSPNKTPGSCYSVSSGAFNYRSLPHPGRAPFSSIILWLIFCRTVVANCTVLGVTDIAPAIARQYAENDRWCIGLRSSSLT
jgi:hypothetical protein